MKSEQQRKEFEALTRPLIEWINRNSHPYAKVLIDCESAELVEGVIAYQTTEYLED